MRPVVITGVGVVSPIGTGLENFWDSLLSGRSGIGRISRFDPTSYACQIGAEVRDRGYEEWLNPRSLRTTTHATQLALGAAHLACVDARLPRGAYAPAATSVTVGTALGGWREGEQQYGILLERGARRVNPFIANGAPNHNPGVEVASAIGAQGPHVTFSNGCSSSLQAIGYGALLVSNGEADLCVAGGVESPLTPVVVASMARTQELSTRNDEPGGASRPFDREHSGIVLGEGSCFVLIESAQRAAERGATRYAEVLGFASSCDAQGVYNFDPSGEPAARAIHRLLTTNGLDPTDIDYVCAHANSSPKFDRKEAIVLRKAFGECAARLPVSSIKGVLGHPLGASGAFQVAASCQTLRHQLIVPTHNLITPDPECDLHFVAEQPRAARVRRILVTSYGYGGVNGCLLLAAPGA